MKPIFTRLLLLFLTLVIYQTTTAQVVSVTSNENWSAAVPSTDCSGCIIQISAGVTLTFTTGGQCSNCTFQGGTLSFQSGSGGFGWYAGNTFQNETLNINTAMIFQGGTFSNDSIYINSDLTLESHTSIWNISHVEIANGVTVTTTAAVSATSSVIALNGTAAYKPNGGSLTLSSSQMYLNSNSYINSTSPLILENTSEIYVGDGSALSGAYIYYNTSGLKIYDNSMIKLSNDNNYLFDWNGYSYYTSTSATSSTSYSTSGSSINCNGAYAHSCSSPYVYGCATLNGSGIAACATLAVSEIDLSATSSGARNAALTWSDPQSSTARSYEVQRSTGNDPWTTIASVEADANTTDYHYNDASAPSGTDDYRIVRTDMHGDTSYSMISSVAFTATADKITIYPNPVTGHAFQLVTGNTERLTASIFSITGQLLMRTVLQGQTQYTVSLPVNLLSGTAVIAEIISPTGTQAFPLLLR